ncbi:MAG: hypothetical protein LUH14_06900 [Clostridiaceae bacterium]|nr:hypothetical protein [Clostridiaceae bacterium]
MLKQLIYGEFYRFFREKRNQRNVIILILAVLGCFCFLIFFERVKGELSDIGQMSFSSIYSEDKSYNLGLVKIWDSGDSAMSSAGSVFDALIPSGSIALLVGLFSGTYACIYRRQTRLYMQARQFGLRSIISTFVLAEILMANFWTAVYEIALLLFCVFGCALTSMQFVFADGFFLWLLCVHINCTAFALLMSALAVMTKKISSAAAGCVSLVLAGSGCLELIIMLFGLPDSVSKIWVLNNLMNTSMEKIDVHCAVGIIICAVITSLFAVGIIILEFSINKKERYR